jgi:hypothetical protein
MGMNPLYDEFQNVQNTNNKEIDIEKIYNKVITTGKDLNLITDIPDSYSLTVMETIADYLEKKYSINGNSKNAKIMTYPIRKFANRYKELNPSVGGKRVSEVLSSLSQFVQYVKNRTTIQKLTGSNDEKE